VIVRVGLDPAIRVRHELDDLTASIAQLERTVAHLQRNIAERRQDVKVLRGIVVIVTGVFLTMSTIASVLLAIFDRQLWDVLSQMEELLRHAPKP